MIQNEADSAFKILAQKLIKEHWEFYPTAGSRIGQHQYDGRIPDMSPAQTVRRVRELQRGLTALKGMDMAVLSDTGRMSYQMMELFLRR